MTTTQFAPINVTAAEFSDQTLSKGLFICLLHVQRVPPHIGLIIDGKYHSLSIKGIETNVSAAALIKTIQQQKIESVFLEVERQPVFSIDHLNSIFIEILRKYPQIISNEITCLSPIRDFLNEFYALNSPSKDMIYDVLKRMTSNNFILRAYSLNLSLKNNTLEIPVYTQEELGKKITDIRNEYY
jgi:hypothetical protein